MPNRSCCQKNGVQRCRLTRIGTMESAPCKAWRVPKLIDAAAALTSTNVGIHGLLRAAATIAESLFGQYAEATLGLRVVWHTSSNVRVVCRSCHCRASLGNGSRR